jgi:VCBS repeat-containing protein
MAVSLSPNGIRLRLERIVRTLKPGERVAIVLTIEAADGQRRDISVKAEVRRRSPADDERRAHVHPKPR